MSFNYQTALAIFLLSILLFSCDSSQQQQRDYLLPTSTGGLDEVLVLGDRDALDIYLEDPVKDKLTEPFEVLPQPEPLFTARIIAFSDLTNLGKRYRTIVVFANLAQQNATTEFVSNALGEKNLRKAKEDEDFYYATKKDVWAEPQLVVLVFANSKERLLENINTRLTPVIELMQDFELQKYRNSVYAPGLNKAVIKKLQQSYQLNIKIPSDYVLAQEEPDFLWLRKIEPEWNSNIMISFKNYKSEEWGHQAAITWRNELGKRYVSTQIEGSYMTTDTILPFVKKSFLFGKYLVYETRGLWRMENDFMGGPFLNYLLVDEKKQRAILVDGFVHAPGEEKRPLVRKLEAIFSTLGS